MAVGSTESVRFDEEYLRRLKEGDAETERHFCEYFGNLLQLKLAQGVRSWQMLQDVRQETLMRVIEAVRADRIAQPSSLGAYVWTTSNYVLWEHRRIEDRYLRREPGGVEPIDERVEIERELIRNDYKRAVRETLDDLAKKDREVLKKLLLEERDKEEVCRELQVTPEYLRVLLHRAKDRFRAKYAKREKAAGV